MNPLTWWFLRRDWRRAQNIHALEHSSRMDLSIGCDAVGHLESIDCYLDCFDRDQRRKFVAERPVKYTRRVT